MPPCVATQTISGLKVLTVPVSPTRGFRPEPQLTVLALASLGNLCGRTAGHLENVPYRHAPMQAVKGVVAPAAVSVTADIQRPLQCPASLVQLAFQTTAHDAETAGVQLHTSQPVNRHGLPHKLVNIRRNAQANKNLALEIVTIKIKITI